jgi:O-methyltransferase involved in polyketide biosynthesis
MLSTEIIENEYKWSLFEDEKAEVIMEVGDIIFENIIDEIAKYIL